MPNNFLSFFTYISNIIWNKKIMRHDPCSTGTPVQHLALLPLNLSRSDPAAHLAYA